MWNHRVMRREYGSCVEYHIYEVYYKEDGSIDGIELWTQEPIAPYGETVLELQRNLERMLLACGKPVLDYDELTRLAAEKE